MIPGKYSRSALYKEHRKQNRSNVSYFNTKKIQRDMKSRQRNKSMTMNMNTVITRHSINIKENLAFSLQVYIFTTDDLENRVFRSQENPFLFNITGD